MTLTPQQTEILSMLRDAGVRGLNSYGPARKVALQLPAVIEQLQQHGFMITTRRRKDRSVDYLLLHEPKDAPKATTASEAMPVASLFDRELEPSRVSLPEIEERLASLRNDWVSASESSREIIRRQARSLEIAKEKILKRQQYQAP